MKITKSQLKQLIKEEFAQFDQNQPVLEEVAESVSLAAKIEDLMHEVRGAMEMLQKGNIEGAMRTLDYAKADLWQMAQLADELENKKPPCPPTT